MTALRYLLASCALAWSVHASDPSPAKLAARVRAIRAQAMACTVALDVGGYRGRCAAPDHQRRGSGSVVRHQQHQPCPPGFSKAVTHSMPLQAGDAGLPIYGEDGRLVGMHIARLSRTLGVLLPVDVLREKMRRLQEQAGITRTAADTSVKSVISVVPPRPVQPLAWECSSYRS